MTVEVVAVVIQMNYWNGLVSENQQKYIQCNNNQDPMTCGLQLSEHNTYW